MTNAFRDLVIGTGRVAADAKAADTRLSLVQRNAAAEGDGSPANLSVGLPRFGRFDEATGVERIGLGHTPQRVARLSQRVETSRRQRQVIRAVGIRCVGLRLRNRLTAG